MKDMISAPAVVPPAPRDYNGVNWVGLNTLYQREVRRFWKVGTQDYCRVSIGRMDEMEAFGAAFKQIS